MKIHGSLHQDLAFYPTRDHLDGVVRLPWSSDSGCMPSNDVAGSIANRDGMTAHVQEVIPSTRSCNRHRDCDEADQDTMLGHGRKADHCNEAYCEDCCGY